MTETENNLLKLIHDTKAVSIWNHKTGPVFWYAASVPGPFYVNTEFVIGPELAEKLLKQITSIIENKTSSKQRADDLNKLILSAYASSPTYKKVIDAMVEKANIEFPKDSYTLVSGGERRDWLFSIPYAHVTGIKHAFLFKNEEIFCADTYKEGETVLHIADLINNAASYFNLWFPILNKAKLKCIGTLCINSRGSVGVKKLLDFGLKTVALNSVDVDFFQKSKANKLIDEDTLTEVTTYFLSTKDWANRYLMHDVHLFDVAHLDPKSFERLQSFFTTDPWSLKDDYRDFFAAMQVEIAKRIKA